MQDDHTKVGLGIPLFMEYYKSIGWRLEMLFEMLSSFNEMTEQLDEDVP